MKYVMRYVVVAGMSFEEQVYTCWPEIDWQLKCVITSVHCDKTGYKLTSESVHY